MIVKNNSAAPIEVSEVIVSTKKTTLDPGSALTTDPNTVEVSIK